MSLRDDVRVVWNRLDSRTDAACGGLSWDWRFPSMEMIRLLGVYVYRPLPELATMYVL